MSTLTYTVTDSVTMVRRNLLRAKRYPAMTVSLIVMPIVLLLMFRYIFGGALGASTDGTTYINYLAPGMMLMIPAYSIAGVAVSVCTDMTKGIVKRFRSMSIGQTAMLTGQVFGTLVQSMLGVFAMTGAALLIGFRPQANALEWLAAFGLVALVVVALAWLGVAFGLAAQNPESAGNMPMPILLLPFFGSGLVPTDTMPAGVRQFAEYQPFTPMTETLRGLLMNEPIGGNAVGALVWCAVLAGIGYGWSKWLLRRQAQ
ncbi:ABC transporter permease [Nocardia sp. NPDC050406]|uniref:ABC transporter permease n=1 Tax=Nocardia sp. NPDC050406 TaxID=3364318 RepID=UPI0037B5C635